jgi:hypothetical protein
VFNNVIYSQSQNGDLQAIETPKIVAIEK